MFFFSSRRRHTRLQGDWSSDVCSSDLVRRACERVKKVREVRSLGLSCHAGLFLLDPFPWPAAGPAELVKPKRSSVAVGQLCFMDRAQRGERKRVEMYGEPVVVAPYAGGVQCSQELAVGANERACKHGDSFVRLLDR